MIAVIKPRSGFTLLEVLLASVIGLLLLGAVYVTFDATLNQANAGRDVVDRGNFTQAIANRLTIDLACCIGPMPPKSGGGIPEDVELGTATATTTTGAAPTEPSTASSEETAAGVATGTTDLSESEGVAAADLPFQGGLFGTDKQITLFVSRVPPALANPETADLGLGGIIDLRPDLRRVTYYIGSGGGLCRQEKPWVTADGIRNNPDPDRSDEASDLIAPEVLDITFSYFGSEGWTSTWTGSDPASDGGSVLGPPRAIQITMVIQMPDSDEPKTITHVIPVRAAVGLYTPPPPPEEIPEDPTTTGT